MPIRHGQFEASRPSNPTNPMNLILEFLRLNSRYAYDPGEIAEELALKGIDLEKEVVGETLDLLEDCGRIEGRTVSGETYYRYCRVVGFRPLKRYR